MSEAINVRHNKKANRFDTEVEGQTAYVEYEMAEDGVMVFTHTIVPTELEGRGIAAQLVKTALEHARESGTKIYPECAYVDGYIARHPEWSDLVDE